MGTEALKAVEAIATVIPTGTMTMEDANTALATTIPMGKPNGVAALAASVKSKHFYLPRHFFITWHQLTYSTDTAAPTATLTARTDTQTAVMEQVTVARTATEATRCPI